MNDEQARIAVLARLLAAGGARGIEVGIGDDAAVLAVGQGEPRLSRLVWTIDEQVEGTHFRRELASWRDVGWRSTMAAASDLAAMGAEPWCALAAIVLPGDLRDEDFEEIVRGQRDASSEAAAPIVGGNLARGPVVSIATTLLGRCEAPVQRRGARPGDGLWLAGRVGLAAAGFRALESGAGGDGRLAGAVEAWRRPRALVPSGLAMAGLAHAAIDVSDGLARHAGHVALASGVAIVFEESALLEDEDLLRAAEALGLGALELALHGGEDYALLASSDRPIEGFRRIGEVREGEGLMLRTASGERRLEARGFDHFDRR
jgi:thiamine-monophosphate kinase